MDQDHDFVVLDRAIDALDRLYDGDSDAVDTEAILRLGGLALAGKPLGAQMVSTADRLVDAMSTAKPGPLSSDEALRITDAVRKPIAEAWSELYDER